jgi:hypothetical protein
MFSRDGLRCFNIFAAITAALKPKDVPIGILVALGYCL